MDESNIIFENNIRINSFECDVNHQWKPSVFFQYLTEAAGNHATRLGCGYEAMVGKDLFWVLSRMKIKFFRFPHAEDQITIRTWPKTIQQKLFYIRDFEILDANGFQLALATSAWLVISATTRRMVMPQSIDLNLPALSERIGLDEPLEKLALMGSGVERLRVQAGYSAVDILGHVNNSRYVDWISDSFPYSTYQQRSLDWIQVNYEREILPGDEVVILSSPTDKDYDIWKIEGNSQFNNSRAFEAMLKWK
jgi:medium-chain acyl-[acyl-carrier-protein] hydrolase